jgi:pyruvate/2-oxoglutarate/acetoin dehydrogenase E1 component
VICDPGWRTAGASAEIAATIAEECFHDLEAAVARVALPDAPAPVASTEEQAYYPMAETIAQAALRTVGGLRAKTSVAA